MREYSFTIKDKLGIHALPAGLIVKKAISFPCDITVEKDGKVTDAKKILGLIGLGVKCGDKIILKADGEQEDIAIEALSKLLQEYL